MLVRRQLRRCSAVGRSTLISTWILNDERWAIIAELSPSLQWQPTLPINPSMQDHARLPHRIYHQCVSQGRLQLASVLCAVLVKSELPERARWCYLGEAFVRNGVVCSYCFGSWRRCFGTLPPGQTPLWYRGDAAHGNPCCGGLRGLDVAVCSTLASCRPQGVGSVQRPVRVRKSGRMLVVESVVESCSRESPIVVESVSEVLRMPRCSRECVGSTTNPPL